MSLTVVIATYRRPELLVRLLGQLASQTLPAADFDVVVVDDGSPEPARAALAGRSFPYRLVLVEQANAGPAAARHLGAQAARGDLLVLVDDDMQVPPHFLAAHAREHEGRRVCVMGRIRSDTAIERMPLFERYRARILDRMAAEVAQGRRLRGNRLCSGNVSVRRADYLAVGGFDPAIRLSEDAELGLRLEQAGVPLAFSEEAYSVHGSDHADVQKWLEQSHRYGQADLRIARKHPRLPHADPFRYLFSLGALQKPFALLGGAAPRLAHAAAGAAMQAGAALDSAGLSGPAVRAAGLAYALEYFGGLRHEAGSAEAALLACVDFLARAAEGDELPCGVPPALGAASHAIRDLREDLAFRRQCEAKYGYTGPRNAGLATELANKIGLQLVAAVRLMEAFRDGGQTFLAKLTSRTIRHVYGSDIHWDAEFAPGVMFIHGMGLAVNGGARIGRRCILNQNVTLGMGRDAATGRSGVPTLGDDVHVGAGAQLIGPIEIGQGTKIMANVVLTESVPAGSIVEAPRPVVRQRRPVARAATG